MPTNWFNKRYPKQPSKSRYSFNISGDIFIEEHEDQFIAEEKLKNIMEAGDGIRVNDYNIEPYNPI